MSKKTEDGIRNASGILSTCWMCGAEHTFKKENDGIIDTLDTIKHKEWCQKVCRWMYERYNQTFREIYNVLELSLEGKKLEIAKDLIGNKLMQTRNDCIENAVKFFTKEPPQSISNKDMRG